MGLIQHHDAISGTERQQVADDYVQRVSQGVDAALVSIIKIEILFFFTQSILYASDRHKQGL